MMFVPAGSVAMALLLQKLRRFAAPPVTTPRHAGSATLYNGAEKKFPKFVPSHTTLPWRGNAPTRSGVPCLLIVFLASTFNGAPVVRLTIGPNCQPSIRRATLPLELLP